MIKSNCRPHIFRHRWCQHTFGEKIIGIIDSPCRRETDRIKVHEFTSEINPFVVLFSVNMRCLTFLLFSFWKIEEHAGGLTINDPNHLSSFAIRN